MTRARLAAVVLVLLLGSTLLGSIGGARAGSRYKTFVGGSGAEPPKHSYYVGDAVYLAFADLNHAPTSYRVCWGPASRSSPLRCWRGIATVQTHPDIIGNLALRSPGTWIARWYVGSSLVGHWTFTIGSGD